MHTTTFFSKPTQSKGVELFNQLSEKISIEQKALVAFQVETAVGIQKILDEKNWTSADLAQKLSVSPEEVKDLLTGLYPFDAPFLAKLSEILGQSVAINNPKLSLEMA